MPSFFPEGNAALPTDSEMRSLIKIVDLLGGGGSSSVGGGLAGVGSPEGVVTARPGQVYTDTSTGGFWNKITGTGNTGWQQLIA